MIYDCFSFFNELELLELRLHELDPIVDKFVLIEGKETYTKNPKRAYYEENKELFKEFKDKIIHILLDKLPDLGVEGREHWTRDQLMIGLTDKCKDDDIIFVGAVDELPNVKNLPIYIEKLKKNYAINLSMVQRWYYVNCEDADTRSIACTGISKYKFVKEHSPEQLRYGGGFVTPECAGWHFSWMGGVEKVLQKVTSFSHTSFNKEPMTNRDYAEKQLSDPEKYGNYLDPNQKLKILSLDENYPKYLLDNKERFKNLIFERK